MNEEYNPNCCSIFSKLCGIFCCPPCPTQITERFLQTPSHPYCKLYLNSESGRYAFFISPKADTSGQKSVVKQDARFVKTSLGNNIAVLFVTCTRNKKFTIVYSHENGADLGLIHKRCVQMSLQTGCDLVSYDYSGYGRSEGRRTERNLYADIKAAWDYTITFREPSPEKIILFGVSIGSVPTLYLASKVQCAGVILQSAFLSSLHIACRSKPACFWSCADRFRNIEKVPKVSSPVLVIHGTDDELIDISQARAIYELCPRAVKPLWIKGAGHSNIDQYGEYVKRLRKFINKELCN